MTDVTLKIETGDTVIVDGNAHRVQSAAGEEAFAGADPDEWQLAAPGAMSDIVVEPDEFEAKLNYADSVEVRRE